MQTLTNEDLSQLQVGDMIFYHLSPNDLPKDPDKEWCGVITAVYKDLHIVIVRVLTENFVGEEDEVSFNQIIRMEKKDANTSQSKA
jgi:hypothetical protein